MRVLALSDLHGNHPLYRHVPSLARDLGAQLLVLAGDLLGAPPGHLTIESAQQADARSILEILSEIDLPTLYIMGNDDLVEFERTPPNFTSVHKRRVEFARFNVVGYQYSLPFMGGRFEKPEKEIASDIAELDPLMDERTLLVTHSPAFGVLDLGLLGEHAGSPSIGAACDRHNVLAHVHGHVHEGFGRSGRHFNVASGGRAVRGALLDFGSGEYQLFDYGDTLRR